MNFIKKLINKETMLYLIFGILTTAVNFIVFKLFDMLFGDSLYLLTNTIAWIAAVIFAYITNKLFVFESKSWEAGVIKKEILSFTGARVFSLVVEQLGLLMFVELFGFGEMAFTVPVIGFRLGGKMLAKIILAVVVVILNYFFSKLIIFRKKRS